MKTIHKVKIDLLTPGLHPRVYAVQDDICTREVQISLYSGGASWSPAKASAAVGYSKPDGTTGLYDSLPDGSAAISISGNVVTVILAAQMLTCAGTVEAAVTLADANGNQISTFAFDVIVSANPGSGAIKSEDYFNYVNPKIQAVIAQAAAATTAANTAASRANASADAANIAASRANASAELAEDAYDLADTANQKVDTLREVVSKFHSNIVETATGEVIQLSDATDMELAGLRIFGKTTQNGTPTPEAPVPLESVGESVNVTVCGKNLVDVFTDSMNIRREGTVNTKHQTTVDTNGNVTINIAASDTYGVGFIKTLPANVPLTISYDVLSVGNGTSIGFVIYDTTDYALAKLSKDSQRGKVSYTFTPSVNSTYMFGWYIRDGVSPCGAQIGNLQLEFGSAATDYEPYKDGGSVTVSTPNGLPGIPVSSGGNYTDENGQQWICDEIDFARGKYVQRIKQIVLDGDENLGAESVTVSGISYKRIWYKLDDNNPTYRWDVVSSHFKTAFNIVTYGTVSITSASYLSLYLSESMQNFDAVQAKAWLAENPTTVQYILEVPIETDLTAEELAAYAALHTNYPNTTVYNDGGAGMEVKYVADTKLYIDKKFAELASAIVNNA